MFERGIIIEITIQLVGYLVGQCQKVIWSDPLALIDCSETWYIWSTPSEVVCYISFVRLCSCCRVMCPLTYAGTGVYMLYWSYTVTVLDF